MSVVSNVFSMKEVENAYVNGDISTQDFVQILVDNFGRRKTKQILKYNLRIAMKKDEKTGKRSGCDEVLSSCGEDSDAGLHDRDNDAIYE